MKTGFLTIIPILAFGGLSADEWSTSLNHKISPIYHYKQYRHNGVFANTVQAGIGYEVTGPRGYTGKVHFTAPLDNSDAGEIYVHCRSGFQIFDRLDAFPCCSFVAETHRINDKLTSRSMKALAGGGITLKLAEKASLTVTAEASHHIMRKSTLADTYGDKSYDMIKKGGYRIGMDFCTKPIDLFSISVSPYYMNAFEGEGIEKGMTVNLGFSI